MTTHDPDPRTAPEDGEDAAMQDGSAAAVANRGESAEDVAEGDDEANPKTDGSPAG